jgi:SAM-dependent methyltransferase
VVTKDRSTAPPASGRSPTQGRILDFSSIASRYDATRDLPDDKLTACYRRLIQARIIPDSGRILDAGCGTGQASLPLVALGYQVLGIDISREMASLAQSKVRPEWRADYIVGDVRSIQVQDRSFDAVVVSKLFQHVQDWQKVCCELIRVARSGTYIIQVNERGAFGNAVRRYFSQKADELGFKGRYAGLSPHSDGDGELVAFMRSQGCQPAAIDVSDLRWDTSVSYGQSLNHIRDGLFAEFWHLPKDVYQAALASTQAWVDAHPHGADTVQNLKPYLNVKVFRTVPC